MTPPLTSRFLVPQLLVDGSTIFKSMYSNVRPGTLIPSLPLVEGKLFVDGLEEGHDVTVVLPDEKFAQRDHSVVVPDGLAACVVFVGYAFIF